MSLYPACRPLVLAFWVLLASAACSAADAADLPSQIRSAPPLATEELGEPVKSVRQGMLLSAPNPDGKTWDLLQIYFPEYGGPNTFVVLDLGSGQVEAIPTERGWNFHLCPSVVAPNGKLFISALGQRLRQEICIYDPATNRLELGAVEMPDEILGETHPLVLGTDGQLYAIGQHPSRAATAVQIDPDTLETKAYGPIGPSHEPNACWGYSGGADDRFVYIASGKIPWYLVAYDRQTGASTTLVETGTLGGYVSVGQRSEGCVGSASGLVDGGGSMDYWLHEGRAIPQKHGQEQPPWPPRAPAPLKPALPEIDLSRAVPDVDGWAEIRVRQPVANPEQLNLDNPPPSPSPRHEKEGSPVAEPPRQPAADEAAAPASPVNPDPSGWRRFRFQVPLYPHRIYRLIELADGRLFGTAGAYEGNFVFDPKTNRSQHLGKIQLSHYATAISGGKIYMSGYPTSPLYVYDPAQPWTAGTVVGDRVVEDDSPGSNPRMLLRMGGKEMAGTHKMYAAATSAGGKVFFGGAWIRDGACGGLAWYDPQTGRAGGTWEPLSNYQVTHMAAADGGRTIVVSTRRIDDPVRGKPKPEQGGLWFVAAESCQLNGPFHPLPEVKGTGPIVAVGALIVGWTENPQDAQQSILYAVDVGERKLSYQREIPFPLPVAIGSNQQEPWDFRLGPDGMIWTYVDGVLVRVDPRDGSIHVVGRPESPGRIAFADDRIYLGGGTALRRLRETTAR